MLLSCLETTKTAVLDNLPPKILKDGAQILVSPVFKPIIKINVKLLD